MAELRFHTISIDSRVLDVAEGGPPDGFPVLALHGTPGSRLFVDEGLSPAVERGIRIIGVSRPGYGGSTPVPGRTVGDFASDTSAVARALGIERFCVYGASGGGPHAIGCAALVGDQVIAAASLCSPIPLDIDAETWMAGMGQDNIEEFDAALKGRETVTDFIEQSWGGMIDANPERLRKALATLLSAPDLAALDSELAGRLIRSFNEGLVARRDGWIDDDLAFVKPWGFDLSSIRVPLLLLHGEQDYMVPFAHARELAKRIPGAEHRFYPEEGHLSLAKNRLPEVLDWFLGHR